MDEFVPYWFEHDRDVFCARLKGEILAGRKLNPTDRIQPPPKGFFTAGAKYVSGVSAVPPDIIDMAVVDLTRALATSSARRIDIGRDRECVLVLDHPTVSAHHAMIEQEPNGARWITDQRSECGTFLNNQYLAPNIKTNVNMNDSVGFGAYKLYLRDYLWLYQQLATRLRRPRIDESFARLVIRYLDGKVVKRVARECRFSGDRLFIQNFLTNKPETFTVHNVKAVFFVKNLLGNQERVDKQGFVAESTGGENMFVEFLDGECMWGNCESYNPNALGFYIKPADGEGNNIQVYVDRRATKYILNG